MLSSCNICCSNNTCILKGRRYRRIYWSEHFPGQDRQPSERISREKQFPNTINENSESFGYYFEYSLFHCPHLPIS